MAPPPRELVNDAISEILLRLPPDEPQWLFRAALVCKPWLRILSDPAFLRRYRDFHGAPPLLGLVDCEDLLEAGQDRCLVPTTAVPAFPLPEYDDAIHAVPLDCRHGRVLLSMYGHGSPNYLVYDPVTGDCRRLPVVWQANGIDFMQICHSAGAVFCATPGCDHLNCHGGSFRVVLVFTDWWGAPVGAAVELDNVPTYTMRAAMYSSEIGDWRAPVELDNVPYSTYTRGPLIGDEIYFAIRQANTIIKYDWANNLLSMVNPPPPAMEDGCALTVMEDHSLGLAGIEDSRLHLWSRRVSSDGIAEWVQCRVIDLEKMMPMAYPSYFTYVDGFAEGVGVIFVSTVVGLFMMELKSGRVRKAEPGVGCNVLPYMSFYTPDRLLGGPADLWSATWKQDLSE